MKEFIAIIFMTIFLWCSFYKIMTMQHSKSEPATPVTQVKKLKEQERRNSEDESIQDMLNLEIIKKQIEEKLKNIHGGKK